MTNPRIERVKTDIDKTKAKISDFQAKLRELEREKTRLEDLEIVALVRSERISDAELNTLMQRLRKTNTAPAAPAVEKIRTEETVNATTDET